MLWRGRDLHGLFLEALLEVFDRGLELRVFAAECRAGEIVNGDIGFNAAAFDEPGL